MVRRFVGWALVVLVALSAAGAGLWWVKRPALVDVTEVAYAPLVRSLRFSARVEALARVDIGSTLTARVERVLVDEGAQVKSDAVLVELESGELRAALAQARATRDQARARLAGLRSTGRGGAQAGVAQAQAAVLAAQAELERVQVLVAQGFLSPARLDEVRRASAVAAAQLAGAQSQDQAVGEDGSEVVQAQAQLRLAESSIVAAQVRLAQTQLRAPGDAQVLARLVEPGQIVQPGRALVTLALAGPTLLSAQVDERFLDQLAIGQPASALADAYPGRRFAARISSISPAVDPQRGSIEVKFALVNAAPDFLREDMTLSIEVETGRRQRTLVVPVASLVRGEKDGIASVLLVQDGTVEERRVRLGLRTLGAVEVLQGLAEGDEVLVKPAAQPGAPVRTHVVEPELQAVGSGGAGGESGAAQLTNMMGR
jgi:HlyD family secretion protein